MRVLVTCEFSGVVRDAFRRRGHDAWSCDLLPSESDNKFHLLGDADPFMWNAPEPWDLIVAFPPCTHLAVSGARWFKDKREEQQWAIRFFMRMIDAPSERVAVENPIGIMSTICRKPEQIIQPWMFGHGENESNMSVAQGTAEAGTNEHRGRQAWSGMARATFPGAMEEPQ